MTRYDIHGETLINDVRASTHQSLSMISLVAQDDDGLLPFLTVRETLRFAACLMRDAGRLGESLTFLLR